MFSFISTQQATAQTIELPVDWVRYGSSWWAEIMAEQAKGDIQWCWTPVDNGSTSFCEKDT